MKQAAVGFRVHSGWAAVVAVCVEKGAPVVLAKQRVHLVETFTYEFRQPYHTAEKVISSQECRPRRGGWLTARSGGLHPGRKSRERNSRDAGCCLLLADHFLRWRRFSLPTR